MNIKNYHELIFLVFNAANPIRNPAARKVPSKLNIGTIIKVDIEATINPTKPLKFTIGNISAPVFFPNNYNNPGPNITIIPFEIIDNKR